MSKLSPHRRLFGVDFSGAEQAGRAIWIAEAVIHRGQARIADCRPASDLPNSSREREPCLAALVQFIAGCPQAVFGCDFPFSLPAEMLPLRSWRRFAAGFGGRFSSPERFRADCMQRAGGRELKRACDRGAKVPFAAYNLRLYRQTFHGIRDVLAPLVAANAAAVLPMEAPDPRRTWVVETCPASTLKQAGLYASYKGGGTEMRRARRKLIDGLVAQRLFAPLPAALQRLAIDNIGGDVLDSMIAAGAMAKAYLAGDFAHAVASSRERLEGRVYH